MTNETNLSGLILEGIPGSGKSSVLKEILKNPKFQERNSESLLVLNEHQTQRVLEQKERDGVLKKSDHTELLNCHLAYIQRINDSLEPIKWCEKNSKHHRFNFIFERFHFTHLYYYDYLEWDDFALIDTALGAIGTKLCVLLIDRDTIIRRVIGERKNNSNWMNYIKRYGATDVDIVNYFVDRQEQMLKYIYNSSLESVFINTNNTGAEETAEQICNFWLK